MKTNFVVTFVIFVMIIVCRCSKNPTSSSFKEEKGKTGNGYFFITSPEENSRINLDSVLNILWIASNKVVDTPNVQITLLKDSVCLKVIASSTLNSGSFKYVLSKLGSGPLYQIKISTPDTSKFDISGFFELYSDYSGTLTMVYPSTGSCLMLDSSDTLRWNYTDFPGPRVRLDLYGDTTFLFTIVESMATTMKKYPWGSVSSPLGTNNRYRIKLTSEKDASIGSYSDYFTIKSIYTGGFTFKSPVSITEWYSGDSNSILWDTTGSPGPTVSLLLFDHDTLFSAIALNITDNGKYGWTTRKGMTSGSDYRIKIISTKDAGIFAMSEYFTIVGIDIDKFEPDNNRSSSHQLTLDTLENHSITRNDADWIQFNADSGSQYLILSKGRDFFRINLKLYFGSEITVLDTASSSTDGRLCLFWNCGKTGKYHVVITPQDTAATGVYSFVIYKFDPLKTASFTSPQDSSEITAGSKVTVIWTPDSLLFGSTVRLYLYRGSEMVMSLSSASLPNSGSFEWVIPKGFESSNEYHLHLVNGTDNRIFGKGPVFTVTGISPDKFENDNKYSSASEITLGDVQEHSIFWNDTDWVRFSGKSGSRYIFLMQCSDSFSTSVSLFRESSKQSMLTGVSDSNGRYSTAWNCQSGADYGIRIVASTGGLFGMYTFKIISFDSLSSVKFTSPKASMILLRGKQYAISWLADSIITGDTVSVSLYRGNSLQTVLTSGLPSGTITYTWSVSDSLPPANNYQIKIANVANSLLYGYSPRFIISDLTPDRYEPDGTSSRASTAIVDSIQNRNIIFNDTDFIKIIADSATPYLISVTGNGQFSVSGSLYFEQAKDPTISFSTNADHQNTTFWSCPKTGIYYCRITGVTTNTTGSYSFKVSKFDPESIISFISPNTGTSWFVDSACILRWNSDKNLFGGNVSINLYKESNNLLQIVRSVADKDSFSWKLPLFLASGTDYRIRIVNTAKPSIYGESPRFTIVGLPGDEYEPDNSWSQARLYTMGTLEQHTITWNDTDCIKFSVDSGYAYQIDVNGNKSFRTSVAVFYENIWSSAYPFTSTISGEIKEMWSSTKNSTAYFEINSYRFATVTTGSYSIKISKFDPLKSITFSSPSSGSIVNEGNSFDVVWIPDSSFLGDKVNLKLYKSDKEVFGSLFFEQNSGKATMSIPKNTLINGNDYRIKIINYSHSGFYGFGPFFTITGIDAVPDAYEVDNTSDAAGSIAFGEVQQHSLYNNDKDWMVFPIITGDRYVLMGSAQKGTTLSVHQGTPVSSDGDFPLNSQFRKQITGKVDGSCYVSINSSISSEIYYTYSFGVAHLDSSTALKITSPAEGVVLTSGQDNILFWTCDTTVYGRNFTATVYRDNLKYSQISFINEGSHTWKADGAVSGSNYRIKIESNLDSTLFAYSPVFSINGIDVDAYEPDNTPDKAAEIILGAVQQHNFSLNDTDWVKLYAQSGYDYIFQGFKDKITQINFELYDSAQVSARYFSILSESSLPLHDTAVFSWSCKTSGMYYLKIFMSHQTPTVNYRLKIIRFDTTQTIEISEPAAGTIWSAGSAHTITWTPQDEYFGAQIYIMLLKGSRREASANYTPNTGSCSFFIPSSVENGTDYRIAISRISKIVTKSYYSSSFTITGGIDPDTYEPDNSKDKASILILDELQHRTMPRP